VGPELLRSGNRSERPGPEPRHMFTHFTLGTNDRPRAEAFYATVLPPLGLELVKSVEDFFAYAVDEQEPPWLVINRPFDGLPATWSNGFHIALLARDEAAVNLPKDREFNTESYDYIQDNPFLAAVREPLSTFSIDVDTASYSNLRRFLDQGVLPPKDAVRIEEMVNYFSYDYSPPSGEVPFSVHVETASAPWRPAHRLLRIGLKGREIASEQRPAANLVFLIDVSGSMEPSTGTHRRAVGGA